MSHIPGHKPSAFDVNASRDPRRDKYEELGFLDYLLSDPYEAAKFAVQEGLDATGFVENFRPPWSGYMPGGLAPLDTPWMARDLARGWVSGPTRGESPEEYAARTRLMENDARQARGDAYLDTPEGKDAAHQALLHSLETSTNRNPYEARRRADEDYYNSPAFEERLDALQAESSADIERRVAEAMTPRGRLSRGSTINPMEAEMLLDEEVNAKYNRLHGEGMGQMTQNDPYLKRNLDPTGRSYPVSWAYPGADIDYKREAANTQARNQRVIDEQNAIRAEEIMTDLFGSKDQRDLDRQLAERTPSWKKEGFDSRDAWIEDRKAKKEARRQEGAETRRRQDEIRRANEEERAREKAQRNAPPARVTTSSGTTTHGPSGQPTSNTGTGNATPEGEGQKKTSSGRSYKRRPLNEILNPIGQFDDAPWLTKNRNQTANQYLYGFETANQYLYG
jgi:hypothetical protein